MALCTLGLDSWCIGLGADFQAPKSLNAFRGEGGRSDVLCWREVLGTGRSTSSYKACWFVASKFGLTPSSDVVVALAALVRCPRQPLKQLWFPPMPV